MFTYICITVIQKILFTIGRKHFLVREMDAALDSRASLFPEDLIKYCKTVNDHYRQYNDFKESFKGDFTYASYDICVEWDTYNRKYAFVLAPKYDTIACIHFTGASS